jgi:hypothetical protein
LCFFGWCQVAFWICIPSIWMFQICGEEQRGYWRN